MGHMDIELEAEVSEWYLLRMPHSKPLGGGLFELDSPWFVVRGVVRIGNDLMVRSSYSRSSKNSATTNDKKSFMAVTFSNIDEHARAAMTTQDAELHDRRRAELSAQLRTGIALRDAREGAGLTQTELAAKIEIALEVSVHRVVVSPADQ